MRFTRLAVVRALFSIFPLLTDYTFERALFVNYCYKVWLFCVLLLQVSNGCLKLRGRLCFQMFFLAA